MNDRRALAAQSYLEARVRGASPAELVGLLYEGLARRVHDAAAALEKQDLAEKGTAIGRALDILAHLRTSLDHDAGGEVATNLERVYAYWTKRLTDANISCRSEGLDEILGQLESVRAAWQQVTEASRGVVSRTEPELAAAAR